jgi:hypothetical protein
MKEGDEKMREIKNVQDLAWMLGEDFCESQRESDRFCRISTACSGGNWEAKEYDGSWVARCYCGKCQGREIQMS